MVLPPRNKQRATCERGPLPTHDDGCQKVVMTERMDKPEETAKSDTKPDVEKLKPYYQELIAEFFPRELRW